jgi:hypothetical protein
MLTRRCVCTCVCVCVCKSVLVVYVSAYLFICTYLSICVYTSVCVCLCVFVDGLHSPTKRENELNTYTRHGHVPRMRALLDTHMKGTAQSPTRICMYTQYTFYTVYANGVLGQGYPQARLLRLLG